MLIAQRANWAKFGIVLNNPIFTALSIGIVLFGLALATTYSFELYFVGYEKSSLRMLLRFDRQIRYDLFWAVVPYTPIYASIAYFMTFGLSGVQWPWAVHLSNLLPAAAIPFFPLQIVAVELIATFAQYWQHRAMHSVPLFWETHKFHHSAEQMTTLSLQRETPFTVLLNGLLTSAPVAIVGIFIFPTVPTIIDSACYALYLAYAGFNALNQFMIHSNLDVSYGWFGRYLMVSPANHRVHHSILPEHIGKNFGVTLVLWDRMFGTFHEGTDERARNCPVGHEGNIYNKNRWIVIEYLYPTFAFFGAIYVALTRQFRAKSGSTSP